MTAGERGPDLVRALLDFVGTENLEERFDLKARTIDAPALAFLRQTFGEAKRALR